MSDYGIPLCYKRIGDVLALDIVPDLPHTLEQVLPCVEGEECRRFPEPICDVDLNATIYGFASVPEKDASDLKLDRVVLCDKPVWFHLFGKSYSPNSGTHRVLFDSTFLGERFIIAIEEREKITCRFKGDAILIGVEKGGLVSKMAEEMGEDFATEMLTHLIYSAIGVVPVLTNGMPWMEHDPDFFAPLCPVHYSEEQKRFEFEIVDVNTIINGGCNLYSPEAKGCFLFKLGF